MNTNERLARRSPSFEEGASTSARLVGLVLIVASIAYMRVLADLGWHMTQEDHAIAAEAPTQSTPETYASIALRMGPVSTGVIRVDDALRGFLTGDVDVAVAQLLVRRVPCNTLPWQGRPPVTCLAGEAIGTVHEVILSACEAKWVPVEAARAELATLLAHKPGLYAISQVSGSYRAVLAWPDAPDQSLVLVISSEGVTSYGAGCGLPLAPTTGHELAFVSAPSR